LLFLIPVPLVGISTLLNTFPSLVQLEVFAPGFHGLSTSLSPALSTGLLKILTGLHPLERD